MNIFDLETFLANARSSDQPAEDDVLVHDARFKVVLDERIVPPLEAIDEIMDRELILSNNRVFCQEQLDRSLAFETIIEATAGGDDRGPVSGDESGETVEYEDMGSLPEGLFHFEGYMPAIHVGKDGSVVQVDLLRRKPSAVDLAGMTADNLEFKKMLVTDVKARDWANIAKLWLQPSR
jgi:hypothetical protein